MLKSARWKKSQGSDYVFYHPHPGFVSGNAGHVHDKMFCFDVKPAVHLVVELPQVLNPFSPLSCYCCSHASARLTDPCAGQAYMCFNWKEHKALSEFNMVITPYVPNVIDVQNPVQTFARNASAEMRDRPTLVYFSGRCTPNDDYYYGKLLRSAAKSKLLVQRAWTHVRMHQRLPVQCIAAALSGAG